MTERTTGERVMLWLFSIACLAGLAWLWLNIAIDGMIAKLMFVGVLWALWVGVVAVATGLIALFLGMVGVVVKPFRR